MAVEGGGLGTELKSDTCGTRGGGGCWCDGNDGNKASGGSRFRSINELPDYYSRCRGLNR